MQRILNMTEKDDVYIYAEEDFAVEAESKNFWRVLIVDDDKAIHVITKLVLNDFEFENKKLSFIHAYTLSEAKELIQNYADTTVILLDVVMEEEDSGLQFVKYLRDELKNNIVRIILRTGQPGSAPEKKVAMEYGINDYKEKNELTSIKLSTTMVTALRAYQELKQSEISKLHIQKQAEQSIQEAEYNLKLITDALPALINYIDTNECIKFNNKVHESWFGRPNSEILGATVYELFGEAAYAIFSNYWEQAISGSASNFDLQLNHAQLGLRYVNIALIPHNSRGKTNGCFCLITDITERKRVEDHLNYLATHDTLTNTFNRSFFDICLTHAINKAERNKQLLAIMFIDLNKFKQINDTLGHDIGDLLLINVAERLRSCLRKGDIIARLGGDEFVILIDDIARIEMATQVAQKICTVLSPHFLIEHNAINLSASIGISLYPHDGQDKLSLLRNADLAMYQVKQQAHQNDYLYYDAVSSQIPLKKLALENKLRAAIDNHELVIYYQPLIHLDENKITCMEALIRWQHPEQGLLLPEQFLPLAEETGLIIPIGEWVLRTACKQTRELQLAGYPHMRVSVNISAQQLLKFDLYQLISIVLAETGLAGQSLELELTESILMQNIDMSIAMMQAIKSLGVTISIDDFGTGYSSLNYLRQLPIDAVKLDKSFMKNINTDISNMTIVSTISRLMHDLGLQVIAEGVETKEQLLFVRNRQYDHIQGYFISPPVTFAVFKELLAKQNQ